MLMPEQDQSGTQKHILTVNIEDYFQVGAFSHLIPFDHWERFDARVLRNTAKALELLAETGNRASFFASGWIAHNHPQILRAVVEQGHEIACQGYYQQSIREISPPAFREDVRRSRDAVQAATGRAVSGFRVGRGWIGPDDLWALEILAEEGFRYDASLCPIGRLFARDAQWLTVHRHRVGTQELWEIPVSAQQVWGWAVPFSGGNYIRQLPLYLTRSAARRWVQQCSAPLVMYFHVWELDVDQPSITAAGFIQRIRHYRNLKSMRVRLRGFLEAYRFTSVDAYLGLQVPSVATDVAAPAPAAPSTSPAAAPRETEHELTVIVPCYNEEDSLGYLAKVLTDFSTQTQQRLRLAYVFVDDGSNDGTWTQLQSLFGDRDDCTLLQHAGNLGIAAAILTGAGHAQSDLVAVLDADCTFDPMQLADMLALMNEGVAVVSASPLHGEGASSNVPAWRMGLSKGAAFLYRRLLNHKLTSYTSCFRVYRRHALASIEVYNQGFSGVAEILARLDLSGCRIVEYPATLEVRLLGHSKINTLTTIFEHLMLMTRIGAARWLKIPLPRGYRP